MQDLNAGEKRIFFWRDERFLRFLSQVLFVLIICFIGYSLYHNMIVALEKQGLNPSFSFLNQTAGFDIGQHSIPFSRSDSYIRALLVGLINTAIISVLSILLSTILGVIVGVARLSSNWLVAKLASVHIELMRNVPLLVLLVLWYGGVFVSLPRVKEAIQLGPVFISNRGIFVPWGVQTGTFQHYIIVLAIGAVLTALLVWRGSVHGKRTGRPPLLILWGPLFFFLIALVGWGALPEAPVSLVYPQLEGFNFVGGKDLTPEFMALLSALVIYTSAFVGETIRAGLQSVSRGQQEAARALGLSGFQTLRFVIFPQAMRVIIPPLTGQYLALTKNSSLAVAIGYPDLFAISQTIHNQSGRSLEVITSMMGVYLIISLITSAFMNWYNNRVRLVER